VVASSRDTPSLAQCRAIDQTDRRSLKSASQISRIFAASRIRLASLASASAVGESLTAAAPAFSFFSLMDAGIRDHARQQARVMICRLPQFNGQGVIYLDACLKLVKTAKLPLKHRLGHTVSTLGLARILIAEPFKSLHYVVQVHRAAIT